MADEEVFEGVDGLALRLTFEDGDGNPRNVGDGTIEVVLQRPDGSTIVLAGAELAIDGDPAAGVVLGTLEDLHLTQVGTYRVQGWMSNLLGTYPSTIATFRVHRSLPRT